MSQLHPLHLLLLHKHQHMMYTTAARSSSASSLRYLPPISTQPGPSLSSCSETIARRLVVLASLPWSTRLASAFGRPAPQSSGRPSSVLRRSVLSPALEASLPSPRGTPSSLPGYSPPKAGSTSGTPLRPPLPSSPLGGVWVVKLCAGRNTLYIPGLLLDKAITLGWHRTIGPYFNAGSLWVSPSCY